MKVVILADCVSEQNAGIHVFAKQWINRVVRQYPKNDYSIIVTKFQVDLPDYQIVVPLKWSNSVTLRIRQLTKLPKLVRQMNPDFVIEIAHFGPFFLDQNTKKVTFIHDLTPIFYPQYHTRWNVIYHKFFIKYVITKADYVITNSHYTKKEIIQYSNKDGQRIVVNYPHIKDIQSVKFKEKKKEIITIGTIEPRKDQITLLRAFQSIARQFPAYSLRIIGRKGWKNEEFWGEYDNLPEKMKKRIIFDLDIERSDLIQRLQQGEIFVFCSIVEGFGLPILEAMLCGLPLILSNIEIHREVADQSALYFETGNSEDLSHKMSLLLGDIPLKESLKNRSHQRAQYFHDQEISLPFLENH